jgi:hypothetical protein
MSSVSANPIHQLVYLSSATSLYDQDELLRILQVSRRNNSANNITGLLLYHEGNIIQFLEGEEQAVSALYDKIESDPRHKGVLPLLQRKLPKRDFGNWSMGFKDMGSATADQFEGFNNLMSIAVHTVADPTMSKEVQRLIRSYRSVNS